MITGFESLTQLLPFIQTIIDEVIKSEHTTECGDNMCDWIELRDKKQTTLIITYHKFCVHVHVHISNNIYLSTYEKLFTMLLVSQ